MASGMDLGKQVGPLPLGAWLAVVGGGLAIGWYATRGGGKSDEELVQLTESGVGAGGGQFIYEPPTTVTTETPDAETNVEWGRKAINWLIAQGYDPGVSENTVNKKLSGENLSIQEQALWNLTLVKFGAPPEPLPPVTVPIVTKPPVVTAKPVAKVVPKPAPKPVAKPVAKKPAVAVKPKTVRHTVRPGDTLSRIAQKHYGSAAKWTLVYNANRIVIENAARKHGRKSSRGGPRNETGWYIYPGTTLTIPK